MWLIAIKSSLGEINDGADWCVISLSDVSKLEISYMQIFDNSEPNWDRLETGCLLLGGHCDQRWFTRGWGCWMLNYMKLVLAPKNVNVISRGRRISPWSCIRKGIQHTNLQNQTYKATHCSDPFVVREQLKVFYSSMIEAFTRLHTAFTQCVSDLTDLDNGTELSENLNPEMWLTNATQWITSWKKWKSLACVRYC